MHKNYTPLLSINGNDLPVIICWRKTNTHRDIPKKRNKNHWYTSELIVTSTQGCFSGTLALGNKEDDTLPNF